MIGIHFKNSEYIPKPLLGFIIRYLIEKGIGNKSNLADFGNYSNAKILGWGFKDTHTYKVFLHHILRNQDFYPSSMVIKKDWVLNNKELVKKFMDSEKCVVKINKGHSGKGIYIIDNVEEIINKINNELWVLQKVIKPVLFEGKKFDIRIYHFILRYEDNYYNILSKVGFIKKSVHNFDEKSKSPYGFLTNISFNNGKKEKHMYEFFDFMNSFTNKEKIINDIYDLIRKYSVLFCNKIKSIKSQNNPKAQIMILGPDIMLNEDFKPMLIETNCSPGILIKGEIIYQKQKLMIEELLQNIIIPILTNKPMKNSSLLSIEKIKN